MAPSRGPPTLARKLHTTLSSHRGPVHVVRYAKGSAKYILSGGQDRTIRLWNPDSGAEIKSFEAHGYEVLSISVYVVPVVSVGHPRFLVDAVCLSFISQEPRQCEICVLRRGQVRLCLGRRDGDDKPPTGGAYGQGTRRRVQRGRKRAREWCVRCCPLTVSDLVSLTHAPGTGSYDATIRLWDLRYPVALYSFFFSLTPRVQVAVPRADPGTRGSPRRRASPPRRRDEHHRRLGGRLRPDVRPPQGRAPRGLCRACVVVFSISRASTHLHFFSSVQNRSRRSSHLQMRPRSWWPRSIHT